MENFEEPLRGLYHQLFPKVGFFSPTRKDIAVEILSLDS